MLTLDGIQLKRKLKNGEVNKKPFGLRISASPLTYIEREAVAALAVKRIGQLIHEGGTEMSQVLRDESTTQGKAMWKAVDTAAAKAPTWVRERIQTIPIQTRSQQKECTYPKSTR